MAATLSDAPGSAGGLPPLVPQALEARLADGPLTLRRMRPDEGDLAHAWATHPDVRPFWGGEEAFPDRASFDREWAAIHLEAEDPTAGCAFVIEVAGRPVGMIALSPIDPTHRVVDLDIVVTDPADRRKGTGSWALRLLCRHLVHAVGVHRMTLYTYVGNAQAERAYARAGFSREGVHRGADRVGDTWVDLVCYALLAEDLEKTAPGRPDRSRRVRDAL